ncbi:YbbJ [uncultured Eubacteriales bacterium]|uniref:YbbJ n=1 Tax=uncultured Eubacteriales bacterium TaxID=172733 RepID=A0A212IV09_9FIRM|nr:YbbJ [uncultured Eubacteriales bacterium]
MNEDIGLVFYESKYDEDLVKFELESAQEQFTAYPQEILQTLVDIERHYILIVQKQKVVGYFVLHENNGPLEIGSHNKALLIRALAVSKNEQGKGHALSAMKMLPDFTKNHFKNIEELVLVVNHANIPAQNLYKKSGFSDTGIRRNGKHGLQFIYNNILIF